MSFSVAHHGQVFNIGDMVYCEDPAYADLPDHKTVFGKVVTFSGDGDIDATCVVIDRADDKGILRWYCHIGYVNLLPSGGMTAEQAAQAALSPVNRSREYVPDRLDQFCVTGPNGRLL